MLERLRETFALPSVTLFERQDERLAVVASAGPQCARPDDAETEVPPGDGLVLALRGRLLEAEDQRVVGAFAAQVAVVLDRISLERRPPRRIPSPRPTGSATALLAAVGHDLRTPLAAAKASVSTLLSLDLDLMPRTATSCSHGATSPSTAWPLSSTTCST